MRLAASLLVAAMALTGCATDYVSRTKAVRDAYEGYDTAEAKKQLEKEFPKDPGNDKLLVMLDLGMVLHAGGRWEESITALAEADRLTGELDAVSISEEAGALLTNERNRAYRGEDFERLMISTLQALNYAQLGKDEDALVEVRRVNERLQKMVSDEKKPYEQLAIARYLGGVLYEDQHDPDNAIIDYQEAQRLQPDLGDLAEPLLRLAKATQRDQTYEAMKKLYPGAPDSPLGPDEGQVVVIVEAGRSPEKETNRIQSHGGPQAELIAVPRYRDRGDVRRASVTAAGATHPAVVVTSLDKVAKVHLDDRIGRTLAKSIAGTVVKAGLAAGVGAATRSKELGLLTFFLLSLTTQADLRSWLSLPAEFQVARLRLPQGKHEVAVDFGGKHSTHEVEVRPGRISILVVRRY